MENVIPTAEQIIAALKEAGVPQRVIAMKLAVPQSAVSDLLRGRRQLKLHEANILLSLVPAQRPPHTIPVIGLAGAGNWIEAIEHASERITLPGGLDYDGEFAVRVSGQSMNLILPEGSFAIIDPRDRSLFSGKIYLLRNGDGEGTIKRYRVDPARFEPVSDDPSFKPFEIVATPFEVIGRVTGAHTRF